MVSKSLSIFSDCLNSIFFGQVCDTCDGAAIYSLLAAIIRTFTIGVGILAVIGIMITGIQYLKSSGNPEKKNKARSRLINVGIGIIIYIALFGIAEFFVPGGVIAHPIASTDETASCPEITYTDTTIRRPENPGSPEGSSPGSGYYTDAPSPYAGMKPEYTTEVKKKDAPDEYNYIEIKNATPYVYMPKAHNGFAEVLNNIKNGTEGNNILIIANAGTFDMKKGTPTGVTIQDGKVFSNKSVSYSTLVIDEDGSIGFTSGNVDADKMTRGEVAYTDGLTGQTISGKKIVSAVSHFTPLLVNGESAKNKYYSGNPGDHYNLKAQRQIICIKADKTNAIITGKNDGRGGGPGGWKDDDMIKIAKEENCHFAFNLDGGGSISTAWRNTINDSFTSYDTSTRLIPSYIVYTDNNLPPGKTTNDYTFIGGEIAALPPIKPKCTIRYKEETDSLKINICAIKDGIWASYVWVKDANLQLNKQYPAIDEKSETTLERARLGNKIAIGFNISEPVHSKANNREYLYYNQFPGYNKRYENAEPTPFIIKNGQTIITPDEGHTNKDARKHFIAWIDGQGNLQHSKRLETYYDYNVGVSSFSDLYNQIKNSGARNTMYARAVFISDGKKTDPGQFFLDGTPQQKRDRGVTLCQLDTNNFIILTYTESTTYSNFQNKILKYGCKTAVSGDGGSSTATIIRNKKGEIITLDATDRGPALFYFTELDK